MEFEYLTQKLKEKRLVIETKSILNEIWESKSKNGNKYSEEFKYLFGLRLFEYAQGKRYDYISNQLPIDEASRTNIIEAFRKTNRSSSLAKQSLRLTIGYNSLTLHLSPKLCNLSSIEANKNYSKTTKDHIIGVTLCAQYVKYIFQQGKESEGLDWKNEEWIKSRIDYMCDIWLKDHLWLWTQCRITKKEHEVGNLPRKRGKKEIADYGGITEIQRSITEEIMFRADLKHYEKARIVLAKDYKNITY